MHKYQLVQKQPEQTEENEIRVKATGKQFHYAAYAAKLLFENKHSMILMLGTGSATAKIIQAVEYLRKRVAGVHVAYVIESTEFLDEYEPHEEGLDNVQIKRLVATLKAHITLSDTAKIESLPGYMKPLAEEDLLDQEKFKKEVENHFNREEGDQKRENRNRGGRGNRGNNRGNRGTRGSHRGRDNYRDNNQ